MLATPCPRVLVTTMTTPSSERPPARGPRNQEGQRFANGVPIKKALSNGDPGFWPPSAFPPEIFSVLVKKWIRCL